MLEYLHFIILIFKKKFLISYSMWSALFMRMKVKGTKEYLLNILQNIGRYDDFR